jgi:hypothetical protein
MNLNALESQIKTLQQRAEALRTTLDNSDMPAAWRKLEKGGDWYRYLQIPPHQHELFKSDGWEPLFRRQQAMAELKARALARAHRGVALVRATEEHHGIH